MFINIKFVPDGFLCRLEVDPYYTAFSIREKIETLCFVSRNNQTLVYESVILKDNDFLEDHDIEEYSMLSLITEGPGLKSYKIQVITPRKIELMVKTFYRVEYIKLMLMAKTGIPVYSQRLTFKGFTLKDENELCYHKIFHDSTIHLMIGIQTTMNINIRIVPDGFLCKLAVDPCYTVLSIKKKVESFYGVPRDKQILVYESAILNDNDFLEDYDIQEDNTIRLVAEGLGSQFLKIEIVTMTGAIIEMQVKSFYLVEDLKLMLMAKSGIPPHQQRLIYAGRQMEDERNLASYRIDTGSTIQLVLRLGGS
ncbi:ubiquitin-related domain-containing protein [Mucor mucedo]|uniref:ubiquitin-related domain-containing protein n=1 Tax=Mucor mucedo TaxID=29922 RepID=UPI00221EDB87|nr:ubiquitin-related domain-containing protein [Mucor mucedo]KAI7897372.1 ubiquitin-related domain-containing protein [Mucor mucedo]